MTPTRVKTWIWVVVGLVAVGLLCVIALAGAGLWLVRTHVHIQPSTSAAATSDLQTIRDRFAAQKPLIELDDHGNFVRANTDRPVSPQRPESLDIMAFDPRKDQVVKVDVPFWLLRLSPHGRIVEVGGAGEVDLAKLRLTVEDLEQFGPTLILDHKNTNGSRVIVWSQ